MKLTRATLFKHPTLRYASGDPVICRVSAIRKGMVYWNTMELKRNGDFWLSKDVYKTDQSKIGQIISWDEAQKHLKKAHSQEAAVPGLRSLFNF